MRWPDTITKIGFTWQTLHNGFEKPLSKIGKKHDMELDPKPVIEKQDSMMVEFQNCHGSYRYYDCVGLKQTHFGFI